MLSLRKGQAMKSKKRRTTKARTDKERLDWLNTCHVGRFIVIPKNIITPRLAQMLRQAIDAAMKAERKAERVK